MEYKGTGAAGIPLSASSSLASQTLFNIMQLRIWRHANNVVDHIEMIEHSRIVVTKMRVKITAYPRYVSDLSQRDSSSRPVVVETRAVNILLTEQRAVAGVCSPWKTSTFQKLTATRKPRVVIMYKIIGIQGLIRLNIRRLRGRVYDGDTKERCEGEREEPDGEAQLDAIGQGAGENGGGSCEGRGWCVRWDRIQGGTEEMGEGTCERERLEGPAIGDRSAVGPGGGRLDESWG